MVHLAPFPRCVDAPVRVCCFIIIILSPVSSIRLRMLILMHIQGCQILVRLWRQLCSKSSPKSLNFRSLFVGQYVLVGAYESNNAESRIFRLHLYRRHYKSSFINGLT